MPHFGAETGPRCSETVALFARPEAEHNVSGYVTVTHDQNAGPKQWLQLGKQLQVEAVVSSNQQYLSSELNVSRLTVLRSLFTASSLSFCAVSR